MYRNARLLAALITCLFTISGSALWATAQPPRPAGVDGRALYLEAHRVWVLEAEGRQIVWYENGTRKSEGSIVQNRRHGSWNFWYENGRPKGSGVYNNGRKTGPWKHYYSSGALEAEGAYLDDHRDAHWIFYYPDGRKKLEGDYQRGLRNGIWINYYENGQIFFRGEYAGGLAHGHWEYFFQGGQVNQVGNYDHETRVGQWRICVFPEGPCGMESFGPVRFPGQSGLPSAAEHPRTGATDTRNPGEVLESLERDTVPDSEPPSVREGWGE